MSSSAKASGFADVSQANWIAFDEFLSIQLVDHEKDTITDYNKPYSSEESKKFFINNFVSVSNGEGRSQYSLSGTGRDCFRYIRTLAAEEIGISEREQYKGLVSSFNKSIEKATDYFVNLHSSVCNKIKKNVENFRSYSTRNTLQEKMMKVFGDIDIINNIERFFSWHCLMHIGRILGTSNYPKASSLNLGAKLHIYRCLCTVIFEGLTTSNDFPRDLFPGHAIFTREAAQIDEMDNKSSSEEDDNNNEDAAIDTAFPRISRKQGKALKLFVLRHWDKYCENHNSINETQFFGPCLNEALQEYNSNCDNYKLNKIDIFNPVLFEQFKAFIRKNWYSTIIRKAKLNSTNRTDHAKPSNHPLEDWNPSCPGIDSRRKLWIQYYCSNIAKKKTISLQLTDDVVDSDGQETICKKRSLLESKTSEKSKQTKKMTKISSAEDQPRGGNSNQEALNFIAERLSEYFEHIEEKANELENNALARHKEIIDMMKTIQEKDSNK